ncbi:PilZ domain-containing protein [Mesorhizobium sp. M0139]
MVDEEHRRERRQRVLKGASIISGITNSEISCTIRNQNSGGAELIVTVESRVPERFVLYVPTDGVAYQAVLRWRRNAPQLSDCRVDAFAENVGH